MEGVDRIEVLERWLTNRDEIDDLIEKGLSEKDAWKQANYVFRKTQPRVADIDRPVKINNTLCKIVFYNSPSMVIKESYESFCERLDDMENGEIIDENDQQGEAIKQ